MLTTEQITILKSGGVAVIPTDTIYGLVGRVDLPCTCARIDGLKQRSSGKHYVTLISDFPDLEKLGLGKYWPGPVSIIFEANKPALRLPSPEWLREVIKQTGPLIATSANPEGQPPATTIAQAKKYFGERIDFYIEAGEIKAEPSTLVRLNNGQIKVLRGKL